MNNTLNYIWSNGLIPRRKLYTTNGKQISVISRGEYSKEKKCFTDTSISIDGEVRTGDTVIQDGKGATENSSLFDTPRNIVLRLTSGNKTDSCSSVAQLNIGIDETLRREYNAIASSNKCPLCTKSLELSELEFHSYLSRLLIERIEQKAEYVISLYEKNDKRWDETLFKLLARSFGFGIQSNAFEAWANTLNLQAVAKHRDNPTQIEAIFFGQAGLLEESTIPSYYLKEAQNCQYYKTLVQEYSFLSRKFNLKKIDGKMWGCGQTTPHLRIARLATLYSRGKITVSTLSNCSTVKELIEILQIQPDGYWRNHTQFGGTTTTGTVPLKGSQAELLIINTAVPMLYAYGKHRHNIYLCERAEDCLHILHSECNSIIKWWSQQGIVVDCAADSQALLQLRKEYCNKQRCTECCFAKHYIKKIVGER